jgi:hypothetical protein
MESAAKISTRVRRSALDIALEVRSPLDAVDVCCALAQAASAATVTEGRTNERIEGQLRRGKGWIGTQQVG